MYTIELNIEQLGIVARALEIYARLSCGQLLNAISLQPTLQQFSLRMDNDSKDEFERLVVRAGSVLTGKAPYASFSIYSNEIRDDARIALHICQAIRHKIWVDLGSKDTNTNDASPAFCVKGLEIKIEKSALSTL